ncbi:hypothetical protein [Paracoccus versutus]|uniref:hypothetical protein n=1 Tax=Paracoccus versutus TaxID=34007 RepID=UPI0011C03A6B|nr:hypothetical protein [Paracoccus versutus]
MQISSGTIALAVLTGQKVTSQAAATIAALATNTGAEAKARADAQPAPGVTYTSDTSSGSADLARFAAMEADIKKMIAQDAQLRDGSLSPFDPNTGMARLWARSDTDPRMRYEGVFLPAEMGPMGHSATATKRDADFPARSDAMAMAYHFGKALAERAKTAVADMALVRKNSDTMLDPSGRIYGMEGGFAGLESANAHGTSEIVGNINFLESRAASLANLFSFDTTSVTRPVYDGSFQGFSITHGTLGKIMDVSADGTLTLYDAEGTAYSAEEYNAANIDGGIPQLHNDLIRQADDRAALASRGVRREASGRIVPL